MLPTADCLMGLEKKEVLDKSCKTTWRVVTLKNRVALHRINERDIAGCLRFETEKTS